MTKMFNRYILSEPTSDIGNGLRAHRFCGSVRDIRRPLFQYSGRIPGLVCTFMSTFSDWCLAPLENPCSTWTPYLSWIPFLNASNRAYSADMRATADDCPYPSSAGPEEGCLVEVGPQRDAQDRRTGFGWGAPCYILTHGKSFMMSSCSLYCFC